MFDTIAVICTGNICRSPIAEELLRQQLQAAGRPARVLSAGTHALVGNPADAMAQAVMHDHGHALDAHRAQQATDDLLKHCDLILVLDRTHVDWFARQLPHLSGRVFKLGKWRSNMDIADPYRLPKAAFEQAYTDIEASIADWLGKL